MNKRWKFCKKFIFLFICIYFFLYVNSKQFLFSDLILPIWEYIIPIFAKLLGAQKEVKYTITGSGDSIFHYYQVLYFAISSLLLAVIIFVVDRKRAHYKTPLKWLMVLLRYYLFSQMLLYGLAKLFVLQFPEPRTDILDSNFGDVHPMALLWTFMGYSQPYTMFTGILELTGGLFLLSRKTVKLGLFITLGVMANVMMLNYFYAVPVKLLSTHLVVICLLLVSFYSKDFISFFLKNEIVNPTIVEDIVPVKWQKIKAFIKWVVLTGFIGFSIYNNIDSYYSFGAGSKNISLKGEYQVEQFTAYSKDHKPKMVSDTLQWKELIINESNAIVVFKETNDWHMYKLDVDKKEVNFKKDKSAIAQKLKYHKISSKHLTLTGKFYNDSIHVKLMKEPSKYRLNRIKFKWIQERPYSE